MTPTETIENGVRVVRVPEGFRGEIVAAAGLAGYYFTGDRSFIAGSRLVPFDPDAPPTFLVVGSDAEIFLSVGSRPATSPILQAYGCLLNHASRFRLASALPQDIQDRLDEAELIRAANAGEAAPRW